MNKEDIIMLLAEEMIKLIFALQSHDQFPWIKEADLLPSLSQQYLQYRHLAGYKQFTHGISPSWVLNKKGVDAYPQ